MLQVALILNYVADVAIWMSNFDNFDDDQISLNFARRKYFSVIYAT